MTGAAHIEVNRRRCSFSSVGDQDGWARQRCAVRTIARHSVVNFQLAGFEDSCADGVTAAAVIDPFLPHPADMTKPAWMTSGSVPGASAAAITAISSGAAGEPSGRSESRDVERNGRDEGRERRSRSRDHHRDGSRDRDRQRRHDRDDRRSRSRSPGRGRDDRDRRRHSESRSRTPDRSRNRDERSSRRRDDDRYVREGSSSRSGLGGGAHSGAGVGSLGSSVAGSVVQAMQSAGFMPQAAGAGFGVSGGGMGGGGAPLIDTKALIAAAMANATTSSSTLAATKTARRLYIGNIGPTTEAELTAFFNAVLARAYQPGDHILSVYINHEKHFAFLEFRTVELTTACLQLDGVYFKGQQLRMRRPNDYNAAIPATVSHRPHTDRQTWRATRRCQPSARSSRSPPQVVC